MGKFTVIPQDTFEGLQMDAGVILKNFNPANPVAPASSDIVCATTGGITVSCKSTFSDLGSDVDNCPNDMKELKHLDGWAASMAFTALGTNQEAIRLALGAADINVSTGAIVPRKDLKQTDFTDLWWVGDKADGGLVAVQLKNALSTEGFSLKTAKNGKGQISVTLTGHVSIQAQSVMPMVFYSLDADDTEYTVTQTLTHAESSYTEDVVLDGAPFVAFLTADTGYTLATPTITMGGEAVTDAWNEDQGAITIAKVTGAIVITETATS